jgi:hypothetical protein
MPVYEMKVAGQDKPRMVRADTPAAARNHIVTAAGITAERMAELMESGVTLEKASAAANAAGADDKGDDNKGGAGEEAGEKPNDNANDPAAHAPGGALHGKGKPPKADTPPTE